MTSIFIRSYRGDVPWLNYCLRSIKKYSYGFHEVVIALPIGDESHFDKFDFLGYKVVWVEPNKCTGYLDQQITKTNADLYCDGDEILFIDSDCVATTVFSPNDFKESGKPVQLIRHWSECGTAIIWKLITQKALGIEPPFEHMAVMPLIYSRHTLPLLRDYVQSTHFKTLAEYICEQPHSHFSEFNLMGSFAIRFTPQLYDWRIADIQNDKYFRGIKQYWSHGGLTDEIRSEIESFL